nr:hypothetical protein [uncultured Rhodopila sp.]
MLNEIPVAADTCSSLDGQKYCSCEYNQRCSSTANSCNCAAFESGTPAPVLQSRPPQTRENVPPPARHPLHELSVHHDARSAPPVDASRAAERPSQDLPIGRDPMPPPVDGGRSGKRPGQEVAPASEVQLQPPRSQAGADTKPPAADGRTARDYVQLAQAAIAQGRIHDALDLIERGQTRLLDRAVDLNKTFDPITDEPIAKLSAARQALVAKDRATALAALESVLAAMK